MSGQSYYPTYFSIEDIMVTQEKVTCKTNVVFPRLGFLSVDSDEEDLQEGVTLNIPLWLVKNLLHKGMNLIEVDVPSIFSEEKKKALEADPTVVPLFQVSPNFYEIGLVYSSLRHMESDALRELLLQVFQKRFRAIYDWSTHRMKDPSKIQELDLTEQRILKAGLRNSELLNDWFMEDQCKLKPAELVINLKKRKLLQGNYE